MTRLMRSSRRTEAALCRSKRPRRAPSSTLADGPRMFPSPSSGGQGGGGRVDAIVVGAGPNGLAAAIVLAGVGKSVHVLEAESSIGGGAPSGAATASRFIHGLCSSALPLGAPSPFFPNPPPAAAALTYDPPATPPAPP